MKQSDLIPASSGISFPRNFRMADLIRNRRKSPPDLYRDFLDNYDLLFIAGKTEEAKKALHLCTASVNNCCCLEILVLPLIHAYLNHQEKSDFKIYYFLQILDYLTQKKDHYFSEPAEKDMIDDFIDQNWNRFLSETEVSRFVLLSPEEKIELFRNDFLYFPF